MKQLWGSATRAPEEFVARSATYVQRARNACALVSHQQVYRRYPCRSPRDAAGERLLFAAPKTLVAVPGLGGAPHLGGAPGLAGKDCLRTQCPPRPPHQLGRTRCGDQPTARMQVAVPAFHGDCADSDMWGGPRYAAVSHRYRSGTRQLRSGKHPYTPEAWFAARPRKRLARRLQPESRRAVRTRRG